MPRPGDIVQGYRLIEMLDQGEFGEVWEAYPPNAEQIVAVKLLHPEFHGQDDPMGPSEADRLRREAEILTEIKHPGVIRFIELIDQPHIPALGYAMERLVGSTLEQVESVPAFSSGIVIYIFRRVAEALAHLHDHGIVHRDVKASNIYVCDPPYPGASAAIKLIDFGLAKALDAANGTRRGLLVGTLENLSPEALTGDPMFQSGATDQWAWGVALFRVLTGHPPFRGEELLELIDAIRNRPMPPLNFKTIFQNDTDAQKLVPIVQRCLAKTPAERFPNMHEVAKYMASIESELEQRRHQRGEPLPLQTLDLMMSSGEHEVVSKDSLPPDTRPPLDDPFAEKTVLDPPRFFENEPTSRHLPIPRADSPAHTPINLPNQRAPSTGSTKIYTTTVDEAAPTVKEIEAPDPEPETDDVKSKDMPLAAEPVPSPDAPTSPDAPKVQDLPIQPNTQQTEVTAPRPFYKPPLSAGAWIGVAAAFAALIAALAWLIG